MPVIKTIRRSGQEIKVVTSDYIETAFAWYDDHTGEIPEDVLPRGLYFIPASDPGDMCTAVHNLDGNAWTEDWRTEKWAIRWLTADEDTDAIRQEEKEDLENAEAERRAQELFAQWERERMVAVHVGEVLDRLWKPGLLVVRTTWGEVLIDRMPKRVEISIRRTGEESIQAKGKRITWDTNRSSCTGQGRVMDLSLVNGSDMVLSMPIPLEQVVELYVPENGGAKTVLYSRNWHKD